MIFEFYITIDKNIRGTMPVRLEINKKNRKILIVEYFFRG